MFLNEQRETRAATAGTRCHKACELEDTSLCESEEEVEAVNRCLAYQHRVGQEKYSEAGEIIVLKEVYIGVGTEEIEGFIGITGGYPDITYVASFFADVMDWKYGAEAVEITKNNLQGISYALGLFEKYPTLQQVTVHFYAPNQGWSDAEQKAKYVHTFHRHECEALELRIRTVVARKRASVSRLEKTGSWKDAVPKNSLCIWCARKGDCAKLHALVIQGASKHSDFALPSVLDPVQLTKPELIRQAFTWSSQVAKIAEAVKARCTKMVLEDNLDVPGLKVVKRTERQTKDIQQLILGAKRAGVGLREVLPLLSIPFTRLEELVKKKAKRGLGAAAVRSLQAYWTENGATELSQPTYYLQEAKNTPREQENEIIEIN